MLPCYNWEYSGDNSTAAALKFQTCQECQLRSGYRTTFTDEGTSYTEQDTTWFLFNNKGAVDWCLFGRFAEEQNKNISASSIYQRCSSSCSKIRSSIDYNIKSDPGSFDFCAHNTNANFTADAAECAECLYQYEDLTILGNVLSTVQDMCDKKPGQNYTLAESVEVYSAERIRLSGNATAPSASPSATSSSSSTPSSSASPSDSGLSKGAIAGIVLGGLLALIALLGLALFLLKRRKNKAKHVEETKGEELAATPPTRPPEYHQAHAGKERFGYAAEADAAQPPVELGDGRGRSELPER
ncbi:hypothetical protein G6514_003224 [Epicoccum nigrum]|nr:hypothetical protein G6514_003224 [Epicoccum nigrum]